HSTVPPCDPAAMNNDENASARRDANEGAPSGCDEAAAGITVAGLRVVRGHNDVLRDLTFDIAPGGVTGLLGPSGSGKTTLLRCILGIQIVTGGTVTVLGHPAGSRSLRSRVGYASQAASVYDDLSVVQNLRYFAAVLGAP